MNVDRNVIILVVRVDEFYIQLLEVCRAAHGRIDRDLHKHVVFRKRTYVYDVFVFYG